MPYDIAWNQKGRILHVKFSGLLTGEEAIEISDINSKYLEEGTAPIHIVVDVTDLEKFPTNIRENAAYTKYLRSPKLGWVVVVGGGKVLSFMVSLIGHLTGFDFTTRLTMNEALEFLFKQDPTTAAKT